MKSQKIRREINTDKEERDFIEAADKLYNHLLYRFDKATSYFKENPKGEDSREYKAYERIISKLSQLEDMKLKYDLFKEV